MSASGIVDLLTILFFLWFALRVFVPSLQRGFYSILGGIIAIATAIAIFLDTSP